MNTETKILFDKFYENISFYNVELCDATKDYLTILEKDLDDYADNIIAVVDDEAHDTGYEAGFADAEEHHWSEGYDSGFSEGFDKGKEEGTDEGKLEGYDEGWDVGFLDGETDAYDKAFEDALFQHKKECTCTPSTK